MTTFFVSAITMDHLNFEHDVRLVERLGVDGLHIDVMDGHFVPRYGIYPEIVKRINEVSNIPLDLHMMVDDIFFGLAEFSQLANIEYVRFHIESCIGNEMRVIDKIREVGARPIACLNLATGFHVLDRLVSNNEIDGVMLMGIHPGVLQQQARPNNILRDVENLKSILVGSTAENHIGLDGAISFETIPALHEAGINNFIGGSSSIFYQVGSTCNEERDAAIEANWNKIKHQLSQKKI